MGKHSFDWSTLDRTGLCNLLYQASSSIVGKKVPANEIQQILSSTIKSVLPVSVVKKVNPDNTKNWIYIGGFYYSDRDIIGGRQIQIVFSYNPTDEFIKISQHRWIRMCRLFADTVMHEMIHMRQYRARGFKVLPGYASTAQFKKSRMEQEYYGHRDELGAYSFNIACELVDRFGTNTEKSLAFLDRTPSRKTTRTTFHRYLEAFEWDHDHKVIKRLKRLVIKNLPYAQAGRPFKTDRHLTY